MTISIIFVFIFICFIFIIMSFIISIVVLQKSSYDHVFYADCDAHNDHDMHPSVIDNHD